MDQTDRQTDSFAVFLPQSAEQNFLYNIFNYCCLRTMTVLLSSLTLKMSSMRYSEGICSTNFVAHPQYIQPCNSNIQYFQSSVYLYGNKPVNINSQEGVHQGDSLGPAVFPMAVHPLVFPPKPTPGSRCPGIYI